VERVTREELAAEALTLIELKSKSARTAMKIVSETFEVQDINELKGAHALLFETLRRKNAIDRYLVLALVGMSINDINNYLKNLLRVAVYEIKFAGKNPAITTNQIVDITKRKFGKKVAGFVNALLRKIEKMDEKEIFRNLDDIARLSVKYGHPSWYVKYLIKLLGRHSAIKMLKKNITQPPLYVRLNTLKAPREEILEMLKKEHVNFVEDPHLPEVVKVIESKKPIVRTNAFREGYIYIQTKASALVSHVLDPKPGELVVDLCAAPGGKTTHIAQLMNNRGTIIASDFNIKRIREMCKKFELMNVKIAIPMCIDSTNPPFMEDLQADRVLVDVPCTSTGAFWSKPEIKWRPIKKTLKTIIPLQWMLLKTAAKIVKPGGIVVYSTCSIMLEENEMLIEKFLKLHSDFELIPAEPFIGIPGFRGLSETQRLFPHLHDTEGFFIAKIKKRSYQS